MKCPHCGITAAAHGAEVLKCWECGRWIEVIWQPGNGSYLGRFVGVKYSRPKHGYMGGWSTRPSDVELLVELCRSLGFVIPFREWKFERLHPGHWQRSAGAWSWRLTWKNGGECGSPDPVRLCLKSGDKADIS